jgi:hypothetical protein
MFDLTRVGSDVGKHRSDSRAAFPRHRQRSEGDSMPTRFARRHTDPVEVVRRDTVPVQFHWHGRRYVVREVLDHWLQTGAWWQAGALTRLTSGESSRPEDGGPTPSGLEDEREFWRVDAAPGPSGTPVVVDLCHVLASGRWALTAVLD